MYTISWEKRWELTNSRLGFVKKNDGVTMNNGRLEWKKNCGVYYKLYTVSWKKRVMFENGRLGFVK